MGQVIQLFDREKPPVSDEVATAWWEWGQEFIANGATTLEMLVEEITSAETETQLRNAMVALKDEVDNFPPLD